MICHRGQLWEYGEAWLVGGPSEGTEFQERRLQDPGWNIQAQLLAKIEMPGGEKKGRVLSQVSNSNKTCSITRGFRRLVGGDRFTLAQNGVVEGHAVGTVLPRTSR